MNKKNFIFTFILFLLFFSCTNKNKENQHIMDDIKNVPQEKWDELAEKKIFFAHQSVGF